MKNFFVLVFLLVGSFSFADQDPESFDLGMKMISRNHESEIIAVSADFPARSSGWSMIGKNGLAHLTLYYDTNRKNVSIQDLSITILRGVNRSGWLKAEIGKIFIENPDYDTVKGWFGVELASLYLNPGFELPNGKVRFEVEAMVRVRSWQNLSYADRDNQFLAQAHEDYENEERPGDRRFHAQETRLIGSTAYGFGGSVLVRDVDGLDIRLSRTHFEDDNIYDATNYSERKAGRYGLAREDEVWEFEIAGRKGKAFRFGRRELDVDQSIEYTKSATLDFRRDQKQHSEWFVEFSIPVPIGN